MTHIKTDDEKLNEVLDRNLELVKTLQFWKIQYKKVVDEKLILQKENNDLIIRNREYKRKIKDSYNLLKNLVEHSIDEFIKFSNNVESIGRIITDYDDDYEISHRESFLNGTTTSSLNNVHPVRPMIGGIILKTPVLRVDRANIDIYNTRAVPTPTTSNNSTESLGDNNNSQNVEIQEVTVLLERIDTLGIGQAIFKEITDENIKGPVVSLSRIDCNKKRSPCSAENGQNSEFMSTEYSPKINTNEEHLESCSTNVSFRDTISENKENSFTNGDEFMDDYQPSDNVTPYSSSRLGCIIEETENISTQSSNNNSSNVFLPKTPKKRHIFSSSGISKLVDSNEDPLEGPSWRFNDNQAPQQDSLSIDNDCEFDDSVIKNINQISNSSIDENDLEDSSPMPLPKYRSTPHTWKSVQSRACNESKDISNINELSSASRSTIEENSKIIPDSTKSKALNTSNTKNGKLSDVKKCLGKVKKLKTLPKRKTASKSIKRKSSSSSNSSISSISVPCVDSSTNVDSTYDRPKRTVKTEVNYKEKPIHLKMRREK